MTPELSRALVTPALATLAAEEGMVDVAATLATALEHATHRTEPRSASLCVEQHPVVTRSSHGSLTFFMPPPSENASPRRVAMFDRRGHLLLLCAWTP